MTQRFLRYTVSLFYQDLERLERLVIRDRLAGDDRASESGIIRRALEFYERLENPLGTVRLADPPPDKGRCPRCGAIVRLDKRCPIPTLRRHTVGLAGLSSARAAKECGGADPALDWPDNPQPAENM